MKRKICITAAMVAVFFAVLWHMPEPAPVEPDPQVQALQTEVEQLREQGEQLRAEMEDVKNVQGYIVWEKDWRNKEGGQ
jgi:cell division protein FtsB